MREETFWIVAREEKPMPGIKRNIEEYWYSVMDGCLEEFRNVFESPKIIFWPVTSSDGAEPEAVNPEPFPSTGQCR